MRVARPQSFVDAGVDTGPPLLCGSIAVRGDEGETGSQTAVRTEVERHLSPRRAPFLERLARGGRYTDKIGGRHDWKSLRRYDGPAVGL